SGHPRNVGQGQIRKWLIGKIKRYSALIPADLMIGHHFSTSAWWMALSPRGFAARVGKARSRDRGVESAFVRRRGLPFGSTDHDRAGRPVLPRPFSPWFSGLPRVGTDGDG